MLKSGTMTPEPWQVNDPSDQDYSYNSGDSSSNGVKNGNGNGRMKSPSNKSSRLLKSSEKLSSSGVSEKCFFCVTERMA